MKNSSDTIGNQTRDLPTCSTAPQPAALLRAPQLIQYTFDIHMSVHRNIIPNFNQLDAMFLGLFIFTDNLHVSGGSSAHHQEHITVHTASGIANQYCC
jgi:hypothetical protein